MKKTIINLGLALVTITNLAMASNGNLPVKKETVTINYFTGSPLCMAICKGDVAVVKKFIEYGANVNEVSNGMTPLMFAARYNNVEILTLLVEKGANLKVKDEKGYTALKHAEISGAKEAVAFLEEKTKK